MAVGSVGRATARFGLARGAVLAGIAVATLAGAWATGVAGPVGEPSCSAAGEEAVIAGAAGEAELTLADGRRLKLAFIDVPEDFAERVEARLGGLAGEPILVRPTTPAADRWGRLPAHVFVVANRAWLGESLLRTGLARLRPEPVETRVAPACLAGLRLAEAQARGGPIGLWADPRHALRRADDTAALLALTGRFAVFEGRVLSIGERRERTYINFGQRWSEDTTVTIPKRSWRAMAERGLSAKVLRGKRVRVRGTVEDMNGPLVEVITPEAIELIEAEPTR